MLNFYKLVKKTKKNLKRVFVPVTMFHSENDETTSYKSVKLLCEGLSNTQSNAFALSKSWHAFYPDDERKIISEKLLDFITSFS
jgi:esterase/lipase